MNTIIRIYDNIQLEIGKFASTAKLLINLEGKIPTSFVDYSYNILVFHLNLNPNIKSRINHRYKSDNLMINKNDLCSTFTNNMINGFRTLEKDKRNGLYELNCVLYGSSSQKRSIGDLTFIHDYHKDRTASIKEMLLIRKNDYLIKLPLGSVSGDTINFDNWADAIEKADYILKGLE